MNLFDSLDPDQALRALALQAAADSVAEPVHTDVILRRAKHFAEFIKTGSTSGR